MHGNWAISVNTDDKKIDQYSRLELSFNLAYRTYIFVSCAIRTSYPILSCAIQFSPWEMFLFGLAWRCSTVGLKTIPLGLKTMLGLKTHRVNAMGYSLIPLGLNVSGVVLNVWVFRPKPSFQAMAWTSNLAWTSGLRQGVVLPDYRLLSYTFDRIFVM